MTVFAAPVRRSRRHESGYAMLMIFLVAAVIAITLYQAVPRQAFESERDKEQLLIDRGEQYKRAIQLYYRKFQKYPMKMEDLENTNNIRFLRKRYVDPMTGKSEWRLIHIGPGGVFTDSLTQKNKAKNGQSTTSVNNFITELGPIGDTTGAGTDAINPGLRRRPSEGAPAGTGDPNAPPATEPEQNLGAANPGGAVVSAGEPPNPNAPADNDDEPNAGAEKVPGVEGVPLNNPAVAGATPPPPAPGVNPGALPSGAPGVQQNGTNGAALIQQMLTGPRPGGPPQGIFNNPAMTAQTNTGVTTSGFTNVGSTPTMGTPVSSMASQGPQILAGSFAGIASTSEGPSIKVYNDHKKYNEWEFIYDYSKDIAKAVGLPVNNNSNSGMNGTPNSGIQSNSSSGQNASTNASSGANSGSSGTSSASPMSQ